MSTELQVQVEDTILFRAHIHLTELINMFIATSTQNAGFCKILLHPVWGSAVYPATIFVVASVSTEEDPSVVAEAIKRGTLELTTKYDPVI